MDVGTKTGAAALEQKRKVMVRTADSVQQGNPKEEFGALKKTKMETPERTDSKSDRTLVK